MRRRRSLKRSREIADKTSLPRKQKEMKRILTFSLIVTLLGGWLGPVEPGWALSVPSGLPISASSAILIDASTQRVIYAKAPHTRRPPASTAKVMTALVILERFSPDRVIRIPRGVSRIEPSKVYLRPGEHYRVRDLVHATLISSANDAAEVLGVAAAGSRAKFAKWMNQKAHKIGCRDTHFVNASGLPPGDQYSTVYDLALIMKEARKNPFIVDSLGRKHHVIRSVGGRKIYLRNHNRLLWRSQRSVIGKTGYTQKGLHCFVGRIQWAGKEVLVSLLGSHRLWSDLKVLLEYQFGVAFYKIQKNRKRWSSTPTRALQGALLRAGYPPGPVDGKFGPRTVRAVELFQKRHGLVPDGIVGSRTCSKLTRYGLKKSYCR